MPQATLLAARRFLQATLLAARRSPQATPRAARRSPQATPRAARRSPLAQSGFTLAALLVIMSVMLIFVAYTVPRQWSLVMRRERELQTIFIMQQYAKAIDAYWAKNNHVYPVSISQLTEARDPRFLRCPKDGCIDPLTGAVDWYIIPQSQAPAPGGGQNAPGAPPLTQTTSTAGAAAPGSSPQTTTGPIGIAMKDYAGGPFVGVRPNKTGSSLITLNGADHYEQWIYTQLDYNQDKVNRQNAAQKMWQ